MSADSQESQPDEHLLAFQRIQVAQATKRAKAVRIVCGACAEEVRGRPAKGASQVEVATVHLTSMGPLWESAQPVRLPPNDAGRRSSIRAQNLYLFDDVAAHAAGAFHGMEARCKKHELLITDEPQIASALARFRKSGKVQTVLLTTAASGGVVLGFTHLT